VVRTLILLAYFLAFSFASFAFERGILCVVAAVVLALILPFLTTVVRVPFAVVINDEIILVQSASYDFLVAIFVHLIVDDALVFDLVRLEACLARGSLSSKLSKCRPV
jgi:membrane-bound metal-dependent hydrolase YbcI (DUF457 family)